MKIIWTEQERDMVAAQASALMHQNPSLTERTAIKPAQELVLPPARRRKYLGTAAALGDLPARVRKLYTAGIGKGSSPAENLGKPMADTSLRGLMLDNAKLVVRLEELERRLSLLETREKLARGAPAIMRAPAPDESLPATPAPVVPGVIKARRPTVLILGLTEKTATHAFRHDLDICVMDTDAARSRAVLRREHIIIMTRWCNHSTVEKYKALPEANLIYCHGAMTDLTRILTNLVSQTK